MKHIVGALLVLVGVCAAHAGHGVFAQGVSEPQTLYWERNGQPNTGTAVGLLYPPEALASLAARVPPATVPATIVAAISQRTPIVAMWEGSTPPDPKPRAPWSVTVVNEDGDAAFSIAPIWIQQQAETWHASTPGWWRAREA